MAPPLRHPGRTSAALGVALLSVTTAAGIGTGYAVCAVYPAPVEPDAETQGVVTPSDEHLPTAIPVSPPPVAIAPQTVAPVVPTDAGMPPVVAIAPMAPVPRPVAHRPVRRVHHWVRIRTRSS